MLITFNLHSSSCLFHLLEVKGLFNGDLQNIHTPIHVKHFKQLLEEARYPRDEINFLPNGFKNGFSLEYDGPMDCCNTSDNIPFTVGDKFDM